jgi:hypothetical protein
MTRNRYCPHLCRGTLRMRLRNSCGGESSAFSTTLAKCSRFLTFAEIKKRKLTPSSRCRCHHSRHLLRHRFPLPLPSRLALVEGEHRQPSSDQKVRSQDVLDVFWSFPMVRLVLFGTGATMGGTLGERAGPNILSLSAVLKAWRLTTQFFAAEDWMLLHDQELAVNRGLPTRCGGTFRKPGKPQASVGLASAQVTRLAFNRSESAGNASSLLCCGGSEWESNPPSPPKDDDRRF